MISSSQGILLRTVKRSWNDVENSWIRNYTFYEVVFSSDPEKWSNYFFSRTNPICNFLIVSELCLLQIGKLTGKLEDFNFFLIYLKISKWLRIFQFLRLHNSKFPKFCNFKYFKLKRFVPSRNFSIARNLEIT